MDPATGLRSASRNWRDTMSATQSPIINGEEAIAFIASTNDERIKAALQYALTTVLIRRYMDPNLGPVEPFDLRFFLEAVRAMLSDQVAVKAIAEGKQDSLRW